MQNAINAGPLAGLRVLDLATTPAGAICTMLLADQGASVVLVEPPTGNPLRALPVAQVWLRGKRSVAPPIADMPSTVDRLCREADVLVVGDPEHRSPPLPLDCADQPRLIVCNAGGPFAGIAGDDDLMAAATGIMGRQPGFRSGPSYVLPPLATYATAILAAQAVGAALYARERTGTGNLVDVPLLSGSLAQQCAQLAEIERPGPLPALRRNVYGHLPLYRLYQCEDGRFLHLGLINARFWPRFCVAIDRPDLISDPRFDAPVRFTSHESRRALMDILAETFVRRPFAVWDRLFDQHDVPCAPALTVDEFVHDPQTVARDAVAYLDSEDGLVRQPGLALHFAGGPRLPSKLAPQPGRHNDDPWGGANSAGSEGKTPPHLEKTRPHASGDGESSRQGPLAGVRILDLSGYIAGPLGPAILAGLGADVIKIEGPAGDGLRGLHAGFLAWNRGKRGICVDLATAAGQEVVHRLAETADVVVENMRPGVADRLNAGYAALSAINPRLIYCYVSAYGSSGPYRHRPGVDPLMQARSGIERMQGGHEHPPVFLLIPATDNCCAMLNAAGIAMALYQRERTGRGIYLETSLLQSAALLQSDPLLACAGRPAPRVNDYEQTGPGPLRRLYRCVDGWLFLAAEQPASAAQTPDLWPALCSALHREDLARDPRFAGAGARSLYPQDLADELIASFAAMSVAGALSRLSACSVPAIEAVDTYVDRFRIQLGGAEPSLLTTYQHPVMGMVTQPSELIYFRRCQSAMPRPAPLLGEHTESLLAELGYDANRRLAMREAGAVAWGLEW